MESVTSKNSRFGLGTWGTSVDIQCVIDNNFNFRWHLTLSSSRNNFFVRLARERFLIRKLRVKNYLHKLKRKNKLILMYEENYYYALCRRNGEMVRCGLKNVCRILHTRIPASRSRKIIFHAFISEKMFLMKRKTPLGIYSYLTGA